MKTQNLQELLNNFNKGLPANTLYTFLTFQKTLHQDLLTSPNKNYAAVFLAFNHTNLRIERFLVNYGAPYRIEITSFPGAHSSLSYNHIMVKDNISDSDIHYNNAIDGKFNKKFFQIFLTSFLYSKYTLNEPNYIKYTDMRLIGSMLSNNRHLLDSDIVRDIEYKNFDKNAEQYIHVPARFYSESFAQSLKNVYPLLNLKTYIIKDMPDGFKYLKREINSHNFINNFELQEKITFFNNKVLNLIHTLG